jgi:hypothetical protein
MNDGTAGIASTNAWNASSSAVGLGGYDTAGVLRIQVVSLTVPVALDLEEAVVPGIPVVRRTQSGSAGIALLRNRASRFERTFRPYQGPDEAPLFEPEDFPVT